jgi:hypothetical protein
MSLRLFYCASSRLALAPLAVALLVASAAGCAAAIALDRAVVAYDTTTAESVAQQLLLNIARARHNQPMHFTAISSIAATYKFSVNAGFGAALTGERGGLLVPVFGASAEENPTISIAPIQGEEFTQRLLTPFQEQKLTLLLRQGYDVDSLLRLLGAESRLEYTEHSLGTRDMTVYYNRPSDREGYAVFRRVMAHLSAIQDRHALFVEPLHFQYGWTIPADSVTPGVLPVGLQGLFADLRRGAARLSGVPADQRPGHRQQLQPRNLVQRGALPAARAGGRGTFQ